MSKYRPPIIDDTTDLVALESALADVCRCMPPEYRPCPGLMAGGCCDLATWGNELGGEWTNEIEETDHA